MPKGYARQLPRLAIIQTTFAQKVIESSYSSEALSMDVPPISMEQDPVLSVG
jgi:hypothetical protein